MIHPTVADALEAFCRSVPADHVITTEAGVAVTAGEMLESLAGNRDEVAARYTAYLVETACAYLRHRQAREGTAGPGPAGECGAVPRYAHDPVPLSEVPEPWTEETLVWQTGKSRTIRFHTRENGLWVWAPVEPSLHERLLERESEE